MISVTGKLNKAAREFQAGDSTGFAVGIGVKVYNRKTQESEWVNYSAAVFAKGAQADFYRGALVEGAIVSVGGDNVLIDKFEGSNGLMITLAIQNAKIEFVSSGGASPAPTQQAKPTKPVSQPKEIENYVDDIPF